jgi:tryptophan synthase alpha chain
MNPFKKNKKQLSIFITAGFPSLESTTTQILELQFRGVDFIEVGIPFSDPMADGEVIQMASAIALKNGMNLQLLFDQLLSMQLQIKVPIVLMGYLNPILQFGMKNFLEKCKSLNISSVIIPDLSLEIYERYYQSLFEKYNIPITFLITPEVSNERVKEIAIKCKKSFVYLVSKTSITGGVDSKFDSQKDYLRIKSFCSEVPIMMGFGISTKKDVEQVYKYCDGAIIGSAFIKSILDKRDLISEICADVN